LGTSVLAGDALADARTSKNGRHALVGLFRQAVFGRLAGYEDVNDAQRLAVIRRCDGSSAGRRRMAWPPRRARWAASRRLLDSPEISQKFRGRRPGAPPSARRSP
jgi:hypothetical protein